MLRKFRMESGPHALGSRSIIADPRDPEMNAKVKCAVKFREWWRPFAPSFKKEAAPDYLESVYDSSFMMLTAQVLPEKRSVIPSVTLRAIAGAPVIMNTSFNLRGEAIVHKPTNAFRTFFSSGMDALVIGSFLIEK
jgi:carbamoyltransferase